MTSLAGQLLIASPRLMDPNFFHAVLFIVQHDEDGAMGLVLNRPLSATMADVCRDAIGRNYDVDGVLHQGGPCPGPLMAVYRDADGEAVLDDLCFTSAKDQLESLLDASDPATRFFINYAGWTAGQLEAEMEEGSWLTLRASAERVFANTDLLWTQMSKLATLGKWIDPDRIPHDPTVN